MPDAYQASWQYIFCIAFVVLVFRSAKAWQKQRATLYLHPPPSLRDTPSKEGHVERNGFKPFPTVCGSEDPYYERKNSTSVACRHLRQRRTLIVGRVSQNAPLRTVRGTVPAISTSMQVSFITFGVIIFNRK